MTSPHPDREPEREGGSRAEASGPEAGGYAPKRSVAARDEAKLSLVALRDVSIVAVLLSIFAAAESWATVSRLGFATFLSVVDGLLVGAATNALIHEWGHFIGARLGGGHAPLKPLAKFLPLYDFDYANNDGRAFLWMSYGGNFAHAALVLVYFSLIHTPGREGTAALVAGAFGFAVFSSLVEIPVIQQARRGVPGLEALGVIPKDFVNRYLPWALGAAFLAYAAL